MLWYAALLMTGLVCARPAVADIYDDLAALGDSISAWVESPPEPWIVEGADLELSRFFPGAQLGLDADRDVIEIEQPLYLHVLRSGVEISANDWHPGRVPAGWRRSDREGGDSFDPVLWMRTCGLPDNLASPRPERGGVVRLTMTGRHTRMWDVPHADFLNIVARLGQGMQVYSEELESPGGATPGRWSGYTLITGPQVNGHHFLTWVWSESAGFEEAVLTPFVPTENLGDLFAPGKAGERDGPIEVRRGG